MNLLILVFSLTFLTAESQSIYDFNSQSNESDWVIVDDGVMGGRSRGNFTIQHDGHGIFSGIVSLENNGGFSSVRHRMARTEVDDFTQIAIRLKGDGKRYQFRVKSGRYDRHSYITYFETSGEWETITVQLSELYPSWRGMQLDMPNYPGETLEEIAFLIANKKAESFRLEIDRIELK